MFAKLAIIIVAIGLTACGLLAMRQARLQATHELAQAQLRIAREDERLLTLHARIAERITPERILELAESANASRSDSTNKQVTTTSTGLSVADPNKSKLQSDRP